jgi:uncharacterized RDD family membrane protein YckC
LKLASVRRRLASLFYELILVLAVAFFSALPYRGAASADLAGWTRHAFQLYLFVVIGLYFGACWVRGGQTLPMKTWRLRVVDEHGQRLTARRALTRYLFAWLSVLPAGAGLLWCMLDRDRQFLHDRLAGTRIVDASSTISVPPTTS